MNNYLLLLPVLLPVIAGLAVMFLKPLKEQKTRNVFVTVSLCVTAAAAIALCFVSKDALVLWKVTENISIRLYIDELSVVFIILMNVMMTLVGIYALEYMEHENDQNRFFGFYLCVMGVLSGIYMASNLISLYLFYELMTLLSLPLVLHSLSKEAISAGLKYLYYSIGGAFLSLLSIFFLYQYASEYEFRPGGILDADLVSSNRNALLILTFIAIIGFGCKAGLFPLHDWLPTAHPVAPAPASAILSGIITKSGVVAIIRLVFYSVGADLIRDTWVQYAWMILALVTVFMGSMMAYREKLLKKRLAYSTVSQVSYILFGLSLLNPIGFIGAIMHVLFHSVIKNDLFMVAGVIIHKTKATTVNELKGVGLKMPVAIWSFTIASLGLIGIPPMSGFISKWYLATGALESEIGALSYIGPAILLISALLTAGYLLPVTIDGFFPGSSFDRTKVEKCEAGKKSVIPIVILAALTVVMGLFPGVIFDYVQNITKVIGL